MNSLKISRFCLLAGGLLFFTAGVFAQEQESRELPAFDLLEKQPEATEKIQYDKSLIANGIFFEDLRLYTLRYNLELLKGKNLSFNGSIGLGVIDQSTQVALPVNSNELDVVVPLEASLLIGQKKHFLQVGLGTYLMFGLEKTEESFGSQSDSGIQISQYQAAQENTSLWLFSNVSYRYQPNEKGLFFNTGVVPTLQSYTLDSQTKFCVGFNIGVGYLF